VDLRAAPASAETLYSAASARTAGQAKPPRFEFKRRATFTTAALLGVLLVGAPLTLVA